MKKYFVRPGVGKNPETAAESQTVRFQQHWRMSDQFLLGTKLFQGRNTIFPFQRIKKFF